MPQPPKQLEFSSCNPRPCWSTLCASEAVLLCLLQDPRSSPSSCCLGCVLCPFISPEILFLFFSFFLPCSSRPFSFCHLKILFLTLKLFLSSEYFIRSVGLVSLVSPEVRVDVPSRRTLPAHLPSRSRYCASLLYLGNMSCGHLWAGVLVSPHLLRKVLDLFLSGLESGLVVIAVGFLTVTLRETLRSPGIWKNKRSYQWIIFCFGNLKKYFQTWVSPPFLVWFVQLLWKKA